MKSCGYHVTATDAVVELVKAASCAGSAHEYATASADSLPFEDGQFDLVVAYNVLMDVENTSDALMEMRRVLSPSGRLMISIVHPFADRGRFASADAYAPFIVAESYFGQEAFEGTEARDGLQMSFFGWSRPLEAYAADIENAGLAITSIREPTPEYKMDSDHLKKWTRIPLFLWMLARPL